MKPLGMLTFAVVFALAAASGLGAAQFAADGRRVTVRTDRFVVEVDGLRVARIENLLTGEVYAGAGPVDADAAARAGAAGVAIESLRPGVPIAYFALSDRTAVGTEDLPDGIAVTYTGLQHGETFDPGLCVRLEVRVDAETGDLMLQPVVSAEIEEVFGARDRGVLHAALQFAPLAEDLRLIIPASDGFSVTKDNVPKDWRYGARWPQFWEAALIIAESQKGCMGIWADDAELHYGRQLGIARGGGWNVTLRFETAKQIQLCTEIRGATWRLNVFDGYWVKAAERYRRQSQQQWPDMEPIKGGTPAWADRIRIVITGPTPGPKTAATYAKLVPLDTIAVFTCQEWLKGWNEGDIKKIGVGMDYFPNYPFDSPTHYHAREDMPAKFEALEKMGIHIFPYTNPTIISHGHPWIRHKIGPRKFFGFRFWQRLYPELCEQVVKTYGVSGIYEDCSWVVARHHLGESGGDNWYRGSARMREYFHERIPQVALMGERNNEVTWRGQKFALSITQWPHHAHPIVTYLCEPTLRMWNLQLQPGGFDADDVRGWMTPWPFTFEENPMQERRILRTRGVVFATEQLKSHWPDAWDPKVMHYFKSAKGEEFRFVRDRGTRFVRLSPDGEETIYWRLGGVTEAEIGQMAVEGWLGYDGRRAVGLNPRAVYPVFHDIERCPVAIASVPEGFFISRCVIRDGFWLADIAAMARDAKPRAGTVRVSVGGGLEVKGFCGADSFKEAGDGQYNVKMTLPGGLGAYWTDPVRITETEELTRYPARNTIHRRDSGLVSSYDRPIEGKAFQQNCGSVQANEEGAVAWLLTIPEFTLLGEEQVYLQFGYGSGHPYGDGANYRVRINGKTVWKRHRSESGERDPKQPDKPIPKEIQRGQAGLKDYAGKTVVLELVSDGHRTSVSESIRWHNPRLSMKPDYTAETDDPEGKAVPSAIDLEPLAP